MNQDLEEVTKYAMKKRVDVNLACEQYGEQHAINPQKALDRTKTYIDSIINKEVTQHETSLG